MAMAIRPTIRLTAISSARHLRQSESRLRWLGCVAFVYNGLVPLRRRVNQAFADVDVQLKQRHDLIPNLVETVKGYASHERGTLEAVVQARNAAVAAKTPSRLQPQKTY